jgi:4-hydroxybenzoyl-CoA reductase subunit beta
VQSADSVPILIALSARAVLASPEGEREVPVEDLYANDGIHYLTKRSEELLTEIRVPKSEGWRTAYRKLRRRGSFDFPVLSVGVAVRLEGERVAEARIVLGAVASAPVRATRAEAILAGSSFDMAAITEAAQAAAQPSKPMDNTDFSFLWRKEMTARWVSQALRGAASKGSLRKP